MTKVLVRTIVADDDALDRMDAARQSEFDRWYVRRIDALDSVNVRYALVRVGYDGADDEIMKLTKRQVTNNILSARDMATSWLNTYRSRAAMRAALETI